MVGSGYGYLREGKLLHLAAVFKLNNVKNSSTIIDMVSGTLETFLNDSNYFEPIFTLAFPQMNYKYTLVMEEIDAGFAGDSNLLESLSLDTELGTTICLILRSRNHFVLQYAHECNSLQNCTPFGGDIGYLPHIISIEAIHCSEYK